MIADRISRGDTLRIGITILAIISLADSTGAVTEINSCSTISSPGEYMLNASIVDSGAPSCVNITSSNVTLDGAGYTIDGIKSTSTYGVFVYDPANSGLTNINVKNLKLTDWYYGIYYNGYFSMVNGTINNNTISSDYSGITLYYVSNYTLTDNNISTGGIDLIYSNNINVTNNNAGVHLYHSGGDTITGNNASSKDGIFLVYAVDNTVTGNDISSNYDGISLAYADNNIIANNKATGSTDTGINLGPIADGNTITNNDISSNNHGIYSHIASNNTITNNIVDSNNYGIYLTSSDNNTIYNNYFNSKNNAWDDGNNTWSITKTAGINIIGGSWIGGNYWSDYTEQDLNSDGLGETLIPYNSFGNITNGGDYLPLIQVNVALNPS